jgi:RHS repeat-associated protein
MSAITAFSFKNSLDLIWETYLHQMTKLPTMTPGISWCSSGLEEGPKIAPTATFTDCEAGVGQSIYIGQFSDSSGLDYLNARYYDSARGQFVSEDPVFWEVGMTNDGQSILLDPQSMNTYSYSGNNPIIKKDPNGRLAFLVVLGYIFEAYTAAQWSVDIYDYINTNIRYSNGTTPLQKSETKVKLGMDAAYELTGRGLERAGLEISSLGLSSLSAINDAIEVFKGPLINYLNNNTNLYKPSAMLGTINPVMNNVYSNLYSNSDQIRQSAVNAVNTSIGGTYGTSGQYGYSSTGTPIPNPNSVWVTPNGAVVTWSGQLVAPPPANKK